MYLNKINVIAEQCNKIFNLHPFPAIYLYTTSKSCKRLIKRAYEIAADLPHPFIVCINYLLNCYFFFNIEFYAKFQTFLPLFTFILFINIILSKKSEHRTGAVVWTNTHKESFFYYIENTCQNRELKIINILFPWIKACVRYILCFRNSCYVRLFNNVRFILCFINCSVLPYLLQP